MSKKFQEYKKLDLSQVNKDILGYWHNHDTFRKTLGIRKGSPSFVFYEGPPSANGMPGIHHVMARSIKDIFCRYKTMQGFLVERKAGWDTHGLPVELGVEKALGITKEDIGKKISITDYNKECRKDVMKYTDLWEELTEKMGYWVDMQHPYITYDNRYIETLWWLLRQLYDKGLLYKGYTIQPYSPAAGTGLSTHELNQPGCYRDVKDTTMVAQFKVVRNEKSEIAYKVSETTDVFFLAWTTTPWTLPSNTALAVGKNIDYFIVRTINPYSYIPITVILAKSLFDKYFKISKDTNPNDLVVGNYNYVLKGQYHTNETDFKNEKLIENSKITHWEIVGLSSGQGLVGWDYEQLIPYHQPKDGDAFRVILGDFVTTEDGTGIVHIAPSFGADDFRVAKENGIGSLTLVDRQGRFVDGMAEFSGRFVKNAYDPKLTEEDNSVDVDLAVMLKKDNKAFKIEKHVHSYPHCWRTDKPVLYYPLDSWFIKTTAAKERMIALNKTINWKPESTGTGRFGKWLENLQDWNLSRSRYWGTPLPIWRTDDSSEEICIGSVADLKTEIEKSVKAGFMTTNPLAGFTVADNTSANYDQFDLHRPFVDDIILVSPSGKPMKRELDLIDVWFDSGAMPYAQIHYPFEGALPGVFPADFVAEGVDQTRGWFFTLHAIASMLFDSVAFKNIVSNGLVLDKNGNKMSKRLGNAVDPFSTIEKYGSDPLRWYMITNASPWDNLKFDLGGIEEVNRKFFGTLYNTYSFFALYANVDGFSGTETQVPLKDRPEIDRWVISLLNSLIQEVDESYKDYEPTRAGRAIQDFVCEKLSNWYVRLNRKRFWGGEMNADKLAAYQTLHTCLMTVAKLGAPIAPFYMDQLFMDLDGLSGKNVVDSVHLSDFPKPNIAFIDKDLEERMDLAQGISSMVLALRRKVSIKVRQPLQRIMVPILDPSMAEKIEAVKRLILTEVNVKELEYITDTTGILVKKIKPNFKTLGPKYSKQMKGISVSVAGFDQNDIATLEREGKRNLQIDGVEVVLTLEDVEILSEDIPGWLVASEGRLIVALDVTLTDDLVKEGIAREFINRIQNLRKDSGFDVTDKISIEIQKHNTIFEAINTHRGYIEAQTLASGIDWSELQGDALAIEVEIDEDTKTLLKITRIS